MDKKDEIKHYGDYQGPNEKCLVDMTKNELIVELGKCYDIVNRLERIEGKMLIEVSDIIEKAKTFLNS